MKKKNLKIVRFIHAENWISSCGNPLNTKKRTWRVSEEDICEGYELDGLAQAHGVSQDAAKALWLVVPLPRLDNIVVEKPGSWKKHVHILLSIGNVGAAPFSNAKCTWFLRSGGVWPPWRVGVPGRWGLPLPRDLPGSPAPCRRRQGRLACNREEGFQGNFRIYLLSSFRSVYE